MRAISPLALLGVWAWLAHSSVLPANTLPSPWAVVQQFRVLFTQQDLLGQLGVSLWLALRGLLIGVSLGLVLGVSAGLWRLGEELLDAPLQMLRTIPFLALTPLFIVWFGIGTAPKLILIALATTFPMYLNTSAGVRNVDRKVVEAARSYSLRGPKLIGQVVFPLALPSVLTGLRFSLTISVLALVAAEQINATAGLGYLMSQAESFQQTSTLFCCVLLYAALGLGADVLVRVIEKRALPWRASVAVR